MRVRYNHIPEIINIYILGVGQILDILLYYVWLSDIITSLDRSDYLWNSVLYTFGNSFNKLKIPFFFRAITLIPHIYTNETIIM